MTDSRSNPIQNYIAVGSGKGGVGKSTVAVNLAIALQKEGYKVGLLDADIYGPSIPTMMGLTGKKPDTTPEGHIIPLEAHGLKTMSIGYITEETQAVIWRGPMIHKMLGEFFSRVTWGELDYLIVDLPPGTGDAQLSLSQLIPLTGAVVVTTPQQVALADVKRAVGMFKKVNVPLLGLVENMSGSDFFGSGGGKAYAEDEKIIFLGDVPLEASIRKGGDEGAPIVAADPKAKSSMAFSSISKKLLESISYSAPLEIQKD